MAHAALKGHDIDASRFVQVTQVNQDYSARFRTTVYDYKVAFNNDLLENFDDLGELFTLLYAVFEHIFDLVLRDFSEGDYVRIVILSPLLETPISLPYVRVGEVTVDQVFDAVANVLNSQDEFNIADGFDIHILRTALPKGAGRISRSVNLNLESWLSKKRGHSIIQVKNDDNICLARAVVVAVEAQEHKLCSKDNFYRFVSSVGPFSQQTQAALKLHENAHLLTKKPFYDLEDAAKFQSTFIDYVIHIYDKFGQPIFRGSKLQNTDDEKHIYLLHLDHHFMVIKSMKSFLGTSFFCHVCQKGHDNVLHRCSTTCKFCHHIRCTNTATFSKRKITCSKCGGIHYSDACAKVHFCAIAERCPICQKFVKLRHKTKHKLECKKFRCSVCRTFFDNPREDHFCFVQTLKSPDTLELSGEESEDEDGNTSTDNCNRKEDMLFFYDIETTFVGQGHHKANLIVCATPYETLMFKGETLGKDFFDMVSSYLKKSRNRLVFIAHNACGFDNTIILKEAYNQGLKPHKIFYRGSKILLLELNHRVRFLCSYLFLPFSLRTLAKNFGLKSQKLYFPYLINPSDYTKASIPFPPESMYNTESFPSAAAYDEFKTAYTRERLEYASKGKLFDIDKENEIYCTNDVNLIKEICQSFSNEFEKMTSLAPFSTGITLPSVCLTLYRMQHLKSSNLLPVFSGQGIETRTRYSKIASTWILHESAKRGIYIQAGHNTGEVTTIGGYRPDGFHRDPLTGVCTIFEFYGCAAHSCEKHYPDPTGLNPITKLTHGQMRTKNRVKRDFYLNTSYRLVEMWECSFSEVVSETPDLQRMFKEVGVLKLNRLIPRDALYGGRVECFKLFVKRSPLVSLNYYDFVSLYPTVMVSGFYSVGVPKIYYGFELGSVQTIDFTAYKGLLYIKILPPKDLGIAVLPTRTKKFGLVFSLCSKCSETCLQEQCDHTDDERALTGVWSHIEILVALREKYVILEVYEIYHFAESSNEVFKSYIKTFIAAKIANSGFPSDITTDCQKDKYVNDMFEQTGVLLTKDMIVENTTRKAIAKLCLNRGKLGQRTNQTTTKVISDPAEFFRLHNNPTLQIENLFPLTEELMHVAYTHVEDTLTRGSTCLMVAIETTALARIKLYETLKAIGPERLVYCDTDSVVFETPHGAWKPDSGNFFGQLQDEIQGKFGGGFLNRFVALGCKTYGMEIVAPDGTTRHELHCKGISLNIRTKKVINFDSMLNLLQHNRDGTLIMEDPYFIRRVKKEAKLASVYLKKQMRFTFRKRRVNFESFETVPLGFKNK